MAFNSSTSFKLVALLGLTCLAAPASANLLLNGSFEDVFGSDWTITGNGGRSNGAGLNFVATDGTWGCNFNGGDREPNAVLFQTFATTVGNEYDLSFDFGKWYSGGGLAALQVEVLSGATTVLDQTVSDETGAVGSDIWTTFQFHFVATDTTTTLRFTDRSNATNGFDGFLDNVSVVPAPSSGLAFSLALVGAARRRRR